MISYFTRYALRQLSRFGLQSALAVLGVIIGVANIILLISITDLGRRQTLGLIGDFGANLLIVTPYIDIQQGPISGVNLSQLSAHLPDEARQLVADAEEIDAVAAALLMPAHVEYGSERTFTTVQGVSASFSMLRGQDVAAGRWLSGQDVSDRSRVACLGETLRRELFSDTEPVGAALVIKGEEFEVVGLMEAKGRIGLEDIDDRVFIPLTTAQQLFEFNGIHGMFARYRDDVSEQAAVEAVRRQLARMLTSAEVLDETFSVFTIKEARDLMASALDIFRAVLAGIASIALLVAGLGIMNVMLIRVMQRRQEIGVRRAVGASTSGIVLQFLLEAAIQALVGSVLGVVLGIAGVYLYCAYADWTPYVSTTTVLCAVAFGVGAGVLFGGYPALVAARQDPIVALRQET